MQKIRPSQIFERRIPTHKWLGGSSKGLMFTARGNHQISLEKYSDRFFNHHVKIGPPLEKVTRQNNKSGPFKYMGYMGVSKNRATPKSHPFLIGFSTIIFTIHFGGPPLFLETPISSRLTVFFPFLLGEAKCGVLR